MGYTVDAKKFKVKDSGGRVGGAGRIPTNDSIQQDKISITTVKRGGGKGNTATNTAGG